MSMIRTGSYKGSINADGTFYNESVEMTAEIDSMPLTPSQLEDAGKRISEMRQSVIDQHQAWVIEADEAEKVAKLEAMTGQGSPAPSVDPQTSKPAAAPAAPAQATLDQGKQPSSAPSAGPTEKQINYIVELAEKTDNRKKLLKSFLAKNSLADLKQLSQKQVDELIMRLRNEV